ncbi:MAG: hypothetical protein ACXV8H_00550 [Chthoniobacterales bacterium]
MLADEEQSLEILPREKSGNESGIFRADIPEKDILAIRHEAKRDK